MKRKKIVGMPLHRILLAAMMVPAMMMAGCSREDLSSGDNKNAEDTETIVIFQLGVPGGSEVEYGRASRSVTGDAEENAVNSLKIYDFQIKALTENGSRDTLYAGSYLLKNNIEGTPPAGSFTNQGGTITARISLSARLGSEHVFVFIANEGLTRFDSIAQVDTIAMEELGKVPIDQLRKTPSTRLLKKGESSDVLIKDGAVMTAEHYLSITEEKIVDGQMVVTTPLYLQRIVARIDVVDMVDAAMNFKLVSVGIRNTAPEGYLSERGSDKLRTASLWTEKYTGTELTRNSGMVADKTKRPYTYSKALYLYESDAGNPPVLVIRYTLNGSPGTKEVEMKDYTTEQYFDIRRNWIYTLKIGDIAKAVLSYQVSPRTLGGNEDRKK